MTRRSIGIKSTGRPSSRSRSVQRRWEALDGQLDRTPETLPRPARISKTSQVSIFGGSTVLQDTLLREMIARQLCAYS